MALFEKIKMESIEEPENPQVKIPKSHRKWTNQTLTVTLNGEKKSSILTLILIPVFFTLIFFIDADSVMFESCALVIVILILLPVRALLADEVAFAPDRITQNIFWGQNVIPVHALEIIVNEQSVEFYHGNKKNINESVAILRKFVTEQEFADIIKYASDVYHVQPNLKKSSANSETPDSLLVADYKKAVAAYKIIAGLMVVFFLMVVFTALINVKFMGVALELSAYPVRLGCIGLAIAAYYLMRHLCRPSDAPAVGLDPLTVRLKALTNRALILSLISVGVAGLGLLLYVLFGNRLDFYLFLFAAVLYHLEFYPRYSAWDGVVSSSVTAVPAELSGRVGVPKRSLQVSLVLMGTLSVISYGESNHYMYKNRQDCLDDWAADEKSCQEVSDSHNRYRYRGPRYGTSGQPIRSAGVGTVSRGGFGSLGNFHASYGG